MAFEITTHSFNLPGLVRPLRLVQLSDLHYGLYVSEKQVAAWVKAALRQRPELIVITGDFVDKLSWRSFDGLVTCLADLEAELGVWGVWGNHDHALKDAKRAEFRQALRQVGVSLLVNEGVQLRPDVYLVGLDDLRAGHPDLRKSFLGCPREAACLVLSHTPDSVPALPGRANFVLAGHTHGGQIRLPLVGALTTSSAYGRRFLEGLIEEPGLAAPVYVSRGLGTTALPLRLNCPAELVVIDFEP